MPALRRLVLLLPVALLAASCSSADTLATDLGIANLAGASLGVSNSIYTLIPEPGTAFLTTSGLLVLTHLGRRRH